jgi:hypothetical protein
LLFVLLLDFHGDEEKESLLDRLLCWATLSPFFGRFFIFRRAQRDSAEKTLKFGLNTIRRRVHG